MDGKVVVGKSDNKKAAELSKLAHAKLRQGQTPADFQLAAQYFSDAIGLKPKAALYFGRGKCFLQLIQFQRALFDFSMAIRMEPSAKHFGSRGWCYRKLSRMNEAQKDYTDAIRLDKDNPTFHFEKGIVYFELNELREAQSEFQQALELSGLSPINTARAYSYRGIAFRKLGDPEKSIEMFKLALNLQNDAETQDNMGLTYVEMQEYEKAKACFQYALEFEPDPEMQEARYINNLGLALYHLGEIEGAIEAFTSALSKGEDSAISFNRGNTYFSQNAFREALSDYEDAVRIDPSCVHLHHVGLAYQGLKDIDQAIKYYKKAIDLPGDPYVPSLLHLGIMYHLDGQYQKAVGIFTHPLLPEDETLLERRGLVYREMERYTNAISDFDMAIAIREKAQEEEKEVAAAKRKKALEEAAKAEAEEGGEETNTASENAAAARKTTTDKPRSASHKTLLGEYYYYRGNVFLRHGDHELAIADFNKALKIGLTNVTNCLNDRGLAYRAMGNLSQACEDLTKACEKSESPEVWCNRAQCWFEQGMYDRADADLCKALLHDSTDPQIYYKRGITRYGHRLYAEAIEDLKKSLELDMGSSPIVPDIYYHLGISYANLNKHLLAVEYFEEALKRSPGRVHYYHERAKSLQIIGQHENAVIDFTKVLEAQPTNARALFRRGFSYKAMKAYEEAAEDFEAAKEFDPNDTRMVLNYRRLQGIHTISLGAAGLEDPEVWNEEKNYDYGKLKRKEPLKREPAFKIP